MSIHRSLAKVDALKRHRNVLSREERIERLVKADSWGDENSIFGLPKVGNIKRVGKKKKKEKKEGEGTEAAAEAKPAAGK